MTELSERLINIIKEAGRIIVSAHSASEAEYESSAKVTRKAGDANFVTSYDVEVQAFLLKRIKELIPDALFIAEEKENDRNALFGECCFIIDPIAEESRTRKSTTANFSVFRRTESCKVILCCDPLRQNPQKICSP